MARFREFALVWALVTSLGAAALGQTAATPPGNGSTGNPSTGNPSTGNPSADNPSTDQGAGLSIAPENLPDTYPQDPYRAELYATGDYVPVLQWRVQSGALPPGITLDESGELRGAAQRAGEFEFVVAVRDGGNRIRRCRRYS